MKVTFTKVHAKRYCVSVEGSGIDPVKMHPAPGYDERLPHDVAHFIVENELGILGGVFGQLASRGTAGTFFPQEAKKHSQEARERKKARRRGTEIAKANKNDALFSEHAIYAAQSRWEKHEIIPDTKIPAKDIQRIIEKFESFAAEWSKLPVGGSITLDWKHKPGAKRKR